MANAQNQNAIEKITSATEAMQMVKSALGECSVEIIKDKDHLEQALALAQGYESLRKALSEPVVHKLFVPLMGTRLGFKTDKDNDREKYPWQIVRDCVIEALIRGFNVVGNEFNIIAGQAYFTKEAYERKVSEFPGLTDLTLDFGVPVMVADKGALVPCHASWFLNGTRDEIIRDKVKLKVTVKGQEVEVELDRRIPVKVNNGMGADAILGKAKRKINYEIYTKLVGKRLAPPEGEFIDTEGETVPERNGNEAAVADLLNKHRDRKGAAATPTQSARDVDAPQAFDLGTGEVFDRDPGQEG